MVRIAVTTFCCFVFLTTLLISGFEILNRLSVAPAIATVQATQKEFLEDYLKDQADLKTVPLLNQPFGQTKNAGTLLNSTFSWHPGFFGEDSVPATAEQIDIKDRFKQAVIRYEKEWMEHNSWFNQESYNFVIFENLREFDHWDLDTESPIEKVGVKHPYLNGIELPIPDVTNLMVLSQLYLMKAVDTKQFTQTLKDIRHVASLLLSTENLSLEMSGLRLLDHERIAYSYYVKHKFIKETDWEPVPAAVLMQATRAWPATAGYIGVLTPDAIYNQVFKNNKPVGLCAALNTSLPHDILLKPMLRPRLWPEVSFRKQYERHDELIQLAKPQCRLKYVTRLMKAGESYHRLPVPSILAVLPFSRRTYGMKLATVGFSGFEIYADPFSRQRDPSSGF
jgi:hypothetical protein